MKLEEIPRVNFWPYDLFGYLLPGATFLTAIALSNPKDHDSSTVAFLQGRWASPHWPDYVLLVFLAYIAGTCISAVSSLVIEQGLLQITFKYPTTNLIPEEPKPDSKRKVVNWLRKARAAWFSVMSYVVYLFAPKYCKAYSEDFQRAIEAAFVKVVKQHYARTHNRFWTCWAYISLYHPSAFRRGSHFVELYGFSRNTAMSFILIAFLPWASHRFHAHWACPIDESRWVWLCAAVAWFAFANYLKVMKRLDDEVFHAFVVCAQNPFKVIGGAPSEA